MQIPSSLRSIRNIFASLIFAVLFVGALSVNAQKVASNATLEQCRNGATIETANPCDASSGGGSGWVTGNTGAQQAHWQETEFVPYRMLFSGLPGDDSTVHTVILGYDILKSGVHALDYLGTYNLTETTAMGNNPCDGVAHCDSLINPTGDSTALIPVDPVITNNFPAPRPTMPNDGVFTMWGGDLIACSYVDPYAGGEERQISCTFTSTVSNPVLSWSGHIGWQGEWGLGNSAGNISGSPYHMRLISLDGSGGNQDRSLSAAAVAIPAKLTVEKVADTTGFPNVDPSDTPFNFTASPLFGTTNFQLFDGPNIDPGEDFRVSGPIGLFGPDNSITISEAVDPVWTLGNIECAGTLFSTVINVPLRNVVVTLQEAAEVTCTFTNFISGPSAAPASVNGRVSTAEGRGIGGAVITIFNATTGESTITVSNSFGYYSLQDLPVSDFYVMTVMHKRYMFLDASRSFTLEDDMFNVNFTASQME